MVRRPFAILVLAALLFSCVKQPQEIPDPVVDPVVLVTSVTLDKTSLTLVEGEEETLVATVKPENAKDKSVTWESSDAKVATVNNEGKVSAIAEGSATITVKSGEVSATCQVKVNAKPMEIMGLESLKSLTFRVDEPVDLVQGLTVTRGGTITRILVKEDGKETELTSHEYVSEFPVESLSFTFTAETPDGKQNATATVEGLTVLPLVYRQLELADSDLGKNWDEWKKTTVGGTGHKQWFEYFETVGLLQTKKVLEQLDLMAPEGRKEKLEHIKLVGTGELPTEDNPWIEGVWEIAQEDGYRWAHPEIMTEKIKAGEKAPNKGIAQGYPGKILWTTGLNWQWANLLQYAKDNPDTKFIFFCANVWVGGIGAQWNPKGTKEGDALEELVNFPNTFIVASLGNVDHLRDFTIEYHQPWIERADYTHASIQGKHSIAAIGGHLTETKFWDYDLYPYEHSAFPIGFDQKNLKVSSGGYACHEGDIFVATYRDDMAAASSWPTAELAATMWNIMALDPDMSFDDLMDLINTYKILIPASHNGEKIQDFDTPDQKEICRQICLPEIPEGLDFETCTDLPRDSKYPAVLWTGQGVEYCLDGQWKSMTDGNLQDGRDIFEAATDATFRFNPVLWKKQGGKGIVDLKVMAITVDGESIPEVEREVSFNL
ncbi:MAG: Ig domain-containing protein [Bacteroidales bacterium]|nr:Ig domain-containing protein [Bacteroidales bacterium]